MTLTKAVCIGKTCTMKECLTGLRSCMLLLYYRTKQNNFVQYEYLPKPTGKLLFLPLTLYIIQFGEWSHDLISAENGKSKFKNTILKTSIFVISIPQD